MVKTITQNNLVSFIYDEAKDRELIQMALRSDSALSQSLKEMDEVSQNLGKLRIRPSFSSVNKVLDYAKLAATFSAC